MAPRVAVLAYRRHGEPMRKRHAEGEQPREEDEAMREVVCTSIGHERHHTSAARSVWAGE
jgi:hypothetical protein